MENRTNPTPTLVMCTLLLLGLDLYNYGYGFFLHLGWTHPYLSEGLRRIALGDQGDMLLRIILLFLLFLVALSSLPEKTYSGKEIALPLVPGLILFFMSRILASGMPAAAGPSAFILISLFGFLLVFRGVKRLRSLLGDGLLRDRFNLQNETFPQERRLLENPYSVNIRSDRGWWNFVNVFSGTLVSGAPGTGKSFVFVQEFLLQLLSKGFTMCVYDYKKGELTEQLYRYYSRYRKELDAFFEGKLTFHVIDFDHPTDRINPLSPALLQSTEDCVDAATIFMRNVNKTWAEKQGDFFPESAITLVSMALDFLRTSRLSSKKNAEGESLLGNCCSLPHAIALLSKDERVLLEVWKRKPETRVPAAAFLGAIQFGAQDQLQGQMGSVRIALGRLATPKIYWMLSGDDVSLEISHPDRPKILCLVNNELRRETYSAPLGLILGQVIKRINTRGNVPCLLCVDEMATVYIKDVDNLIATARSNRVATLLCLQDYSQLVRDYGKRVGDVVKSSIGNIVTGKVLGETARDLQELFGKIKQRKDAYSSSSRDTSHSESTQMDYVLPAAKISALSTGEFAGVLSDTIEQPMAYKLFRGKARIDPKPRAVDESLSLPTEVKTQKPEDKTWEEVYQENFQRIDQEVSDLLEEEYQRLISEIEEA